MTTFNLSDNPYFEWLKRQGLSSNTIKAYGYFFSTFEGSFSQQEVNAYLDKYEHTREARAFLKSYKKFLIANQTILKLNDEQVVKIKLIDIPTMKKRPRKIPNVLNKDDVIFFAEKMPYEKYRIMVLLSYYCGLRISEVVNIRVKDLNFNEWDSLDKNGLLKVTKAKGNKQRLVPVPSFIMLRIGKYINDRIDKGDEFDNLFNVTYNTYRNMVRKYSKKILQRNVNPHLLRHSFASYLMEHDWDIRDVQEFLGHEDIKTTQLYVHINPKHLQRKYLDLNLAA